MWRCDSGSVRKMPKHQSAHSARLARIFWPFRIQWSPSRVALEGIASRSLPALGWLHACAQTISLDAIVGRKRGFCSLLPTSMIVGPSRKMPFWFTRPGAPAR